jgi:hypothetical protein
MEGGTLVEDVQKQGAEEAFWAKNCFEKIA